MNSQDSARLVQHSIEVSLSVPDELKLAALLHDMVEDKILSLDGIEDLKVRAIVDVLTRRSWETYADYIRRILISGNKDAITIKVADIQANLKNPKTPTLVKRYQSALEQLTEVLPSPEVFQ